MSRGMRWDSGREEGRRMSMREDWGKKLRLKVLCLDTVKVGRVTGMRKDQSGGHWYTYSDCIFWVFPV